MIPPYRTNRRMFEDSRRDEKDNKTAAKTVNSRCLSMGGQHLA